MFYVLGLFAMMMVNVSKPQVFVDLSCLNALAVDFLQIKQAEF